MQNRTIIFLAFQLISVAAMGQKYEIIEYTIVPYEIKNYSTNAVSLVNYGSPNDRIADICEGSCVALVPLAVNLLEFEVARTSGNNVELNWEATESANFKKYEIERSFTDLNNFVKIFTTFSTENKGKKSYQLSDINDFTDYSYYRLKMLDANGRFEYSKIQGVKGYESFEILKVLPNPIANNFEVIIYTKNTEIYQLVLTDIKGNILQNTYLKTISGKNNFKYNAINFPKGEFLISLISKDNLVKSRKVLKN